MTQVLSLWKGVIKVLPDPASLDSLLEQVCREYGIRSDMIVSHGRTKIVSHARDAFCDRARAQGHPWKAIAWHCGTGTHGAAWMAARRHRRRLTDE